MSDTTAADPAAATAADAATTTLTPEAAAPQPGINPEAKAEGNADAAEQGKPKTETAAGDWKLTAPEGMGDYQGDFDAFAKDMNGWLAANPNATAREALAEAAARQARSVTGAGARAAEQHAAQVAQWEAESRADSVIGGAKFDENIATAIKGLDAVADDAFRALLTQTGLGNHPAVIRTFLKVGQQVADTAVVKAPASTESGNKRLRDFYGSV